MQQFDKLIEFRQTIYDRVLTRYKDAQFELVDALLLSAPIHSFPELICSPAFRRQWHSVYTAVEDGRQDQEWLEDYLVQLLPSEDWLVFPLDTTAWPHAAARTMPDRQYVHSGSDTGLGSPVVVGHPYSVLAWAPERNSGWAPPLSVHRVPSEKTEVEVGVEQVKRLCHARQAEMLQFFHLIVADGKYGNHSFLGPLQEEPCGVLVRMRCDRVVYKSPGEYKRGRRRPRRSVRRSFTPRNSIVNILVGAGPSPAHHRLSKCEDLEPIQKVESAGHGSGQGKGQRAMQTIMEETELSVREWLAQFPPDTPVVVVPAFNAYEDLIECLESLLTTTSPSVPILVIDDASTDGRVFPTMSQWSSEGKFLYIRRPTNTGFVNTVNLAFEWSRPRDVIVLNSDVVVPPQWLERLRAAAYCMSTVATATPLTNSGTIVSVPYRSQPIDHLIGGKTVEEVDARIRANSLRLYPTIPTAVGHCVYFRRLALDLVGYFDPVFSPGYGEEVDFSQRAVMVGFYHVVADDLFVYHKGSRSFRTERQKLGDAHEHIVNTRYPWYRDWTTQSANEWKTPLSFAVERAQSALVSYHIAIDLTKIGGPLTGTQVHTLELICALLAEAPIADAHLSLIIPDHVQESELLGIENIVYRIYRLSELQGADSPYFHLVHRPFQLQTPGELVFLRRIAERAIISQLDFIAFSNPAYANSYREWAEYKEATRLVFNTVDGIIFLTKQVVEEAAHLGLYIEPDRLQVIPPGANHHITLSLDPSVSSDRLPSPPFILMLGVSFLHKNRLYALKVLNLLISRYGWKGKLVFAGPTPSTGSSEPEELAFLQNHPEVQPYVCYLGSVTEGEKTWLLKNASLVLYPSTREGFGLVPFEAAAVGTPALTVRISALTEILGEEVIYLDDFNLEKGAAVIWSFLSDPEVRAFQIQALQKRMAAFTWKETATRTWEFYQRILNMPPRFSGELLYSTSSAYHPIIASPPQTPLLKRAIRRVAQTIRVCANEWRQLFREVWQYLRFLRAQRLTKSKERE